MRVQEVGLRFPLAESKLLLRQVRQETPSCSEKASLPWAGPKGPCGGGGGPAAGPSCIGEARVYDIVGLLNKDVLASRTQLEVVKET